MLFSRHYRYSTHTPEDEIKKRLIGQHVKIHKMDFEIFDKDRMLKIIPHAEQETNIKTLPITHVEFKGRGDKTDVLITSKMRKIDKGGPLILIFFCCFLMAMALIMLFTVKEVGYEIYAYPMIAASLLVFGIFWLRLESGYFDYVRKIRKYVKDASLGTAQAMSFAP
ncbi:MAG: hypothetical protein JST27_06645 [Bacteroidetes bacterium]|nr:hypothetical protein [Bacteroidota bacterium]